MIDLENLAPHSWRYFSYVEKAEPVDISNEDMISCYEKLLAGAMMHRADNASNVIPNIVAMINWLRSTDFYRAPASTKYHEAHESGLLCHTLKAYNKMVELIKIPSFSNIDIGSATLVILAHDWCKIGRYESYLKNVKNDTTGVWEQVPSYKHIEGCLGLGHGPQSLIMLSQFCTNKYTKLTFDEMAAIRWHMSTYDVTSYDLNDMSECCVKIPLVLLTQFADHLSICEV